MAKKQRRKGPGGIGYVGKKVETEVREFSSDLFFKKAKANNEAGLTYISFNSDGKLIQEFQGRKFNSLADDDAAITASELVNSGVLTINPTTSRLKTIPTLLAMYAFIPEDFSAYDFTIVNTNATNQLRLARGDTDTAIVGDTDIRPGTSATFRLLNLVNEMLCVRLNSDRNSADITSVVAGTNLTGGATFGAATINLADASTSVKGAASFSSDNFAASSGAITIKDGGVDLTAEVTGVLPSANLDADTAHLSTTQTFTGAKTFDETISGSIDGNAATATNLTASTSTAVGLGTIELGHASDTTIARSASGKVTIEGAPIQTTQMSMTHHHFFMNSSSNTVDFFFPYNNLNEASSLSQYYTRTIAPYAGRIVKVLIRPSAAIGTACKLQFHKITDTTLNFGTAVEEVTSINLNTAETSVSTAFSSATFSAGDVVNVSLIKSSTATANIQAVIVWEYTI
jgi:hypothetical protein